MQVWESENVFDLLVYKQDDVLDFEVFDYDLASEDDSIGKPVVVFTVAQLLASQEERTVELGGGRGTLTFTASYGPPAASLKYTILH